MRRPDNFRELRAGFENPKIYAELQRRVEADLKEPRKKDDWIWYFYPQSESDVPSKNVHHEYTDKNRADFKDLFKKKVYQNLFQKVNAQPISWFKNVDQPRVNAFRIKNAALIASVSQGAAPAAAPAVAPAFLITDFVVWLALLLGAMQRTHYYRLQKKNEIAKIYARKRVRRAVTTVENVSRPDGGMQNFGSEIAAGIKIGAMIAGNNGRPGGAVGVPGGIDVHKVHARHTTQEEDVVSSWLLSERAEKSTAMATIFQSTVGPMWGMRTPEGTDTATIQGFDYKADPRTGRGRASDYANAWVVRNAFLSPKYYTMSFGGKTDPMFALGSRYPATLVFVAGPNANPRSNGQKSTMFRTYSNAANKDYAYFRAALKEALCAGLDAMAAEDIDVALIAGVSTALYAGPWKATIARDFLPLCYEIANERVGPNGERRGRYFDRIVYPTL